MSPICTLGSGSKILLRVKRNREESGTHYINIWYNRVVCLLDYIVHYEGFVAENARLFADSPLCHFPLEADA